ncbi:hypothetical protein Bhyg_00960 [Pseudolycoriella hygida]|uniref:Uncharacterized protein n=1 Tax=Pseudolycoriella hygida TaxID=35572 RepID=A0A9Q0NA48_9DIPT|nr:hypothetical protein Bhyg_00960 [Pseudolycoriella hygida]
MVTKNVSIYNLRDDKPLLTMKLCNFFDDNNMRRGNSTVRTDIQSSSVDSAEKDEDRGTTAVDVVEANRHIDRYKGFTYVQTEFIGNTGINELKNLTGFDMEITILNTSKFHPNDEVLYEFENRTSPKDYCPNDFVN